MRAIMYDNLVQISRSGNGVPASLCGVGKVKKTAKKALHMRDDYFPVAIIGYC